MCLVNDQKWAFNSLKIRTSLIYGTPHCATIIHHRSLPYIGYVPDGIPLDANNCPSYTTYDSNWPKRFYRVGYGSNTVLSNEVPSWGEMKCGSLSYLSPDDSNASMYTEVPKSTLVSAKSGGSFQVAYLISIATLCSPTGNKITTPRGPCAYGEITDGVLDAWQMDNTKTLTNYSNGI